MKMKNDLSGQKYGRLLVKERTQNDKTGHICWKCICECGNECIVRGFSLLNGKVKSCGCLKKEQDNINLKRTHRQTGTRIYNIYNNMKQRCYNTKKNIYNRYGGRGITVCDEWRNNFESFYKWAMQNGYQSNLTLDRINNNGNYEPSNCRWTDMKTQTKNREITKYYTYNGEKMTITEISEKYNIKRKLLSRRLIEDKWEITKAIETPVKYSGGIK